MYRITTIWIFSLICLNLQAQQQKDFNVTLVGNAIIDVPDTIPGAYKQYNDVWGYVAPDGTEYGILGAGIGTAIFSLQDPTNPEHIITVPGVFSRWRDMKSLDTYIYVVADEGDDGLLIIDMTQAPDTITWKHWKPELPILGANPTLRKCHNLHIDSCYAFLAGCNNGSPQIGTFIIDLCSDPLNPTYITTTDSIYAHDAYAQGDRLYLSNLGAGFSIVDISDRSAPKTLAIQETSRDFTHNAWASHDGNYLFTTDERFGAYVDAYDISNPDEIILLDKYRPVASEEQGAIPHNVHYLDGYLITSYYTDGVKIVDANRPQNLIEVGSYDTYFFRDGSFGGHWGAYPYLPSGLILSSDRSTGLYVFQPNYQRAAYLEGVVRDSLTGMPLSGVEIRFNSDMPGKDISGNDGSYATGLAADGTQAVTVFLEGYHIRNIEVSLTAGKVTMQDINLLPLERYNLQGTVIDAVTGAPLAAAQVIVFNDRYESLAVTDASGNFSVDSYEGQFVIAAGLWGYEHETVVTEITDHIAAIELRLEPGYRDDFVFDLGWTVTSSINTQARQSWQRGNPAYYIYDGMRANPDADIPEDLGNSCYVTGLEGSSAGNLSDTSILTSPIFDLSSYVDPYLYYFTWFYDNGVNPADDQLEVWLSNGLQEVRIEVVAESGSTWRPRSEIRIKDWIDPSADMQLRLIAADVGAVHLYEAGLDGFAVSDGQTTSNRDHHFKSPFEVFPNPFVEEFVVKHQFSDPVNYQITNLQGQLVQQGTLTTNNSKIQAGALTAGFYFLTLYQSQSRLGVKKLLKS